MKVIRQVALLVGVSLLAALLSMNNIYSYIGSEFTSSSAVPIAAAVALGDDGHIELATNRASMFIGVATAVTTDKVTVANSGVVDVYVSDIDGPIASGTRLGLSAYGGVATVWHPGRNLVGVVQVDSRNNIEWQKAEYKNSANGEREVINVAKVSIQLTQNADSATGYSSDFAGSMQRTAQAIAGHSVAWWRVLTAIIVGGGSLLLAFCLLISTGRGSFISIGRNPLASATILRGMWRIVFASAGIMIAGTFAAYLILRIGAS
jgi:hypothetical protein